MIKIITRSDDAGSSKGANQAIFEAVNHPFVKNISLMAPGHYIEEAAQYLKDKKHICLGMHFTMNAEWDNVKWGPVSPVEDVWAMLDASGNFLAEPKLSSANGVTIEMIRKEWNAQLDRLTRLGLDIRYADSHMFPEIAFEGLDDEMSRWIQEKGLVDHRYFYNILPQIDDISQKAGLFEKVLSQTSPGQYFYLTHPAVPTQDMYLTGNSGNKTENIVSHREKDYQFIISEAAVKLCEKYDAVTIRYDEADASAGDKDSGRKWLQA